MGVKKKKGKVKISLYINQTPYVFGCLCTFCQKQKAVCHCPECKDFYCDGCNVDAHSVEKRKHHVPLVTFLSHLDLPTAAGLITRSIRFTQHLKRIQRLTRKLFRRFFDRKSLNHYYYNPVYGTVSWRKPYCLRAEELFPFLDEYRAACWIQGLWHMWVARYHVVTNLKKFYKKAFDRQRGLYFYSYHGPSLLMPKQQWKKPVLFGRRAYPYDILPIYTIDVAAVIIQRKWRSILVKQFIWNLVRVSYVREWDPVGGCFRYLNKDTRLMQDEKPSLLKNQPWDPSYVPDWTPHQVSIFLRRIGLKQYAGLMLEYGVDGSSALMLDDEDFTNMNIMSKVHRRKIYVELRRVYKTDGTKLTMSDMHAIKRERIRKARIYKESATFIQRIYRGYVARVDRWNRAEVKRVRIAEDKRQQATIASAAWWLESEELNKPASANLPLPPVKDPLKAFGRRRDHKSSRGWGRWGLGGEWIPLENNDENEESENNLYATKFTDSNPTRLYTERLRNSGYDAKRYAISRGKAVFSSKPIVDHAKQQAEEEKRIQDKINARLEAAEEEEEEHF